MSKRRTAQGKMIDMGALIAKNENVRAVGNMKVNARGDEVDGHGRVVTPVTEKVAKGYSKTVGNKSAQVTNHRRQVQQRELTKEEIELEQQLEADFEVEQIKKTSK
jgi:hypothetical protein